MTGPPVNGFIAALAAADRVELLAHLKSFPLVQAQELQEQGERTEHVYFPLTGIISLLATMEDGRAVESAIVGHNGGVGLAAGFGPIPAVSRALVQAPGIALRMPAGQFHKLVRRTPSLMAQIGMNREMMLAQVQQTAACNILHGAEHRLARWLLQADDLLGKDEAIPFTQEFLSNILGVRRTTVTLVASALQAAGLIRYRRGLIQVLARSALEDTACECYRAIRKLGGRADLVPPRSRH